MIRLCLSALGNTELFFINNARKYEEIDPHGQRANSGGNFKTYPSVKTSGFVMALIQTYDIITRFPNKSSTFFKIV